MNPKVSVIVPVYKAEQYLGRCVDSILAQTLNEIEIILIDDGSPDNCGQICDNYARENEFIHVIHQGNAGASSARNAGIDVACGEYIGFVDSDDDIAPEMYELLYNEAKSKDVDFLGCGYRYKNDEGEWAAGPSNLPTGYYNYEQLVQLFVKPLLGNEKRVGRKSVNGYSWMGIFRKEILNTYNIRFPSDRKIFEDELFYFAFFKHVKAAAYLDKPLYHYYIHESSLTHRYWDNMWEIGKELISDYRRISRDYGIEQECVRRIDMYFLFFVVHTVMCVCLPSVELTSKERTAQIKTVFQDEETKRVFRDSIVFEEPKFVSFILAMAKKNRPATARFVIYHYFKITKRKTI